MEPGYEEREMEKDKIAREAGRGNACGFRAVFTAEDAEVSQRAQRM
jgi:hypothetical protein